MLKAKDIMRTDFPKASPDETLDKVLEKMLQHEYGGVLVLTEEGELEGVVTERDVLRVISSKKNLGDVKVGEVVKKTVIVVYADVPFKMVLQLFGAYKIRRLPVIDSEGKVVGVISSTDAVYRGIPKVLHPLAGKLRDVIEEPVEVEDDLWNAVSVILEKGLDGVFVGDKLISQRSLLRAYLEGGKPSDYSEPYVTLPSDTPLKNVAEIMRLNGVRFVVNEEKKYAFTRQIAIGSAELVENVIKSYVLIDIKTGNESQAVRELYSIPNVVSYEYVTGPFDLVLTLLGSSIDEITDIVMNHVRSKPYVNDTLTLIVFDAKTSKVERE
ncbi:histidine kinase [Ignicoccus islandicus DSM 13165]|uniref:Histidine kinase n=1 Tax=Ignicoccus islandicus DSM 13165 TaxID=940295 RepID=A0A0U3FMJ9_9CREN|nr:CBS domain-containing protein [Ignicoccus islandicus]ALU11599.1 histidine kinase [Ignicoccus islandicus DSM 13165]